MSFIRDCNTKICFGDVREAQNIRRQWPLCRSPFRNSRARIHIAAYSCTNRLRFDFIVILAEMEIGFAQLPIDCAVVVFVWCAALERLRRVDWRHSSTGMRKTINESSHPFSILLPRHLVHLARIRQTTHKQFTFSFQRAGAQRLHWTSQFAANIPTRDMHTLRLAPTTNFYFSVFCFVNKHTHCARG